MQTAAITPKTYGMTGLMKAERGTFDPPRPAGRKAMTTGCEGSARQTRLAAHRLPDLAPEAASFG
jgi:hypothetical protein